MKTYRCSSRLAWVLAAWSASTYAAAPTQTAEQLYQDAMRLMERGEFVQACPKLEQSHTIDPAVATLLYLGECYDRLGKTGSAWSTFERAAAAAKRSFQPDRARIAETRAAEVAAQAPLVTFVVPLDARVTGLTIQLDGVAVPEYYWGRSLPMDPGAHSVLVSASARIPWSSALEVRAVAQKNHVVTIPLLALANATTSDAPVRGTPNTAAANQAPSAGEAVALDRPRERDWQRISGLALSGVGVVGLAVGTVFGLRANSKERDSEAYCRVDDKSLCNQRGLDLLDEGRSAATIANIGLVGGALALAGGAILYLTAPPPPSGKSAHSARHPLSARLTVAPRAILLEGEF